MQDNFPHPPIVSSNEWLSARKELLSEEKALTKHGDRVSAARRRLPMVRLEKSYRFEAPSGEITLKDLFEDRLQLIVYHFMFDPEWDKGCSGCTWFVDALGDLSMLNRRNTSFALVSRAPLPKLESYKRLKGWDVPWVSSLGSDFNYDFHATIDENVASGGIQLPKPSRDSRARTYGSGRRRARYQCFLSFG